MKTGLIISTYNSPGYLGLVLASIELQTRRPDQLVIADDGSAAATRSLIDEFRERVSFPVLHCWQPDQGHRKTRILNQAIVATDADYLISCDGDMVLHPEFVNDHCRIARPGRYTQGRRINMNRAATERRLQSHDPVVRIFQRGFNRRPQMIRSRRLMEWLSTEDQSLKNSRGCNQAFWRDDLLAINGFEEVIEGWGREDTELCARLHNLGRCRIYARHWALAYHLDHPELPRDQDDANLRLLAETIDSGRVRAIRGIDQQDARKRVAA